MKKLEMELCAGIGDNLVIRICFDSVKENFDQIRISHSKQVINFYRNGDPKYFKFLNDLGKALFSEPPFIFDNGRYPSIQPELIIMEHASHPKKPNLDTVLCKGESLKLDDEYIVVTTKARCLKKKTFYPLSIQLWSTLRELSKKYKIVVMGERTVEISKEYKDHTSNIFGIYEQIISNIPPDRIVDLTVPALGITVPDFNKIQQDCLIMKEAKVVITLGIGGNFWLSAAVANTLGFRDDFDKVTDLITNPDYPTVFTTRDWSQFMEQLEKYK